MSLQVWLPFTDGTLKQQGLSDAVATSGGTIDLTNVGKLGKCVTLGAAAGGITLPASTMTSFTECSVTFWINIISWNTNWDTIFQAGLGSTPWNNYIFGILRNQSDHLCFAISNGSSTSSGNYASSNLTIGQWIHLAFTYSNGKCKIYINGVLDKEYSTSIVPNFAGITHISIGRGTSSGYQSKCKLNDLRIYNHALSPMEIKRISQGLVLHYPLNREGWGQENLIWNSNWNIHSTTPPESWVNWGSPPTREIVTIDGKNWLHVISNTTQFQGYSQNWTKRNGVGELTANTKMTVSFTAKLAAAASIAPIGIHWCNSSGTIITQNWTTTALTTSPKRYSFTYTTPADCVAFNIMVGDNTNTAHEVWVTDIKLEFGEIATPWCPNSSDELATTMGLNEAIEYDTSGFCNNGARIGTFSWSSDTPKYTVSTHIGATNQKVFISNFPTSGFENSYSFAWWGKRTSNSPMFWGFSNGIRLNGMYTGTLWNTGDSGNNPIYSPGTTTTITAPSVNVWHHYVMTGDGTTCKLYLDGELYGQAKTYKAISGTAIYINGWDSSTAYCSDNTDLSDFRIYATALSAEDVEALYENSAYVATDGTMYAYDFVES